MCRIRKLDRRKDEGYAGLTFPDILVFPQLETVSWFSMVKKGSWRLIH